MNGFFVCIYYLVNLVAGILHPVTIIGRENLPEHGALLCPNHNSNWDPVLVALKVPVNYRLHIMAKKELFCNKVFDWVLRKLGAFPVDRGEGDIEAVKTALKAIKSGDNLLIFPEGTRVEHEGALPAKGGVAVIASVPGRSSCRCTWRGTNASFAGPASSSARHTGRRPPAVGLHRRRSRHRRRGAPPLLRPGEGGAMKVLLAKSARILLRREAGGGAGRKTGRRPADAGCWET